jgi:RNA polymerase sigma-70 factor (ECF subfamily)
VPDEPTEDSPASPRAKRDTLLGAPFPTTDWSVVLQAQRDDAAAALALNELCRRFWYPIYAFLRCRGHQRADAQDLTQGFFLKAVRRELVGSADQEKGRLRTFLLTALNRHVADHLRHESAQKRGGRAMVLPHECDDAEHRFAADPLDHADPERLFLGAWARALLERVREKMRAHYEATRRGELYAALEQVVTLEDETTPYAELAQKLSASETALRLQVFRMRQRFAKLLREEVAQTVHSPEDLESEIAWLKRTLSSAR